MDTEGVRRLDSFPYRHRVRDVMTAPVATCAPRLSLAEAARIMADRHVSSLVVVEDGALAPAGIVTERDVLRAVAEAGTTALDQPIGAVMSRPVHSIADDAFVYVAIARMDRLNIRHLPVVDATGALAGILSARALLKSRAQSALLLGDEIQSAEDDTGLTAAVAKLPAVARALLDEAVAPRDIARVIAAVMRDATARAAALAERSLAADGRGPAPAAYAVLVLGSAGRGESLLVPDQDNAIVHGGSDGNDPWFAELGRRMCATLDRAGIPYCRGGVMAQEQPWRHPLDGWRALIDRWVRAARPDDLLNVDIFYDFRAVHGDPDLAATLRDHATQAAASSPPFLRLLAANLETMHAPLGLFGTWRTAEGRIDLKLGGLLPIVTGARIMALKGGVAARATPDRLAAAVAAGTLTEADGEAFAAAHSRLLGAILEQQLADETAGVPLSSRVAPGRLDRATRRRLKDAVRTAETTHDAVRDVLTAG